MSSFVIGSVAAGFQELHVRTPMDGATYEPIQTISTSLGGTSTVNRKAVKRRYAWPLAMMTPTDWVALRDLWLDSPGPYWLWDASETMEPVPPGLPTTAAGWFVVLIEGISRSHPNGLMVSPTINLREV